MRLGIIIIIIGVVAGILLALISKSKKPWTPPRDVNREYRGEIIQKLRQGKTAPVIKKRSVDIKPEKRKQKIKEITPPKANKKEFEPSGGENYSDF